LLLVLLTLVLPRTAPGDPGDGPGTTPPDDAATSAPDPAAAPARSVGDVTVTATRGRRDVLETPGNVTVIDRQAIDESGAANVPELLRREAGIYVANTTTNRTGYQVEPRGFNNGSGGGSSLLVLVDGRRVNEPESSVPAWELLHLDDIERIEIVRGPASALYGDNAVAGVVQILTRSGEGPPRATATGRLGEHRTKEGSLWAGGSAGPLSLAVFADQFQSDSYRDQALFRIRTYKGRLDLQLGERASFSLRGGYSSDDREPPGPLTETEIDDDRQQADPDSLGSLALVRSRFVDGVIEATPLDDVHLSLQGYFTRRSDESIAPSSVGVFGRLFETEAIGINTKIQIDREVVGRPVRTVVGVDLLREDREGADAFLSPFFAPSATIRRTRRETLGAYLQTEIDVREDLRVIGGVRHDRAAYRVIEQDAFGGGEMRTKPTHTLWSPNVGLVYRIDRESSAYVSYARGFRLPNLEETSGVFADDPEISPQRSRSIELGVKHRSERLRANLAIYRMDVKDEIVLDSDVVVTGFRGPLLGLQTVNLDRVRHQGIEASWAVDLFDWLELHGAYTWNDTRVLRDDVTDLDGKRVPIQPRHRGTLGLLARLPYWIEAGIDVDLVGRRYGINDFGHDLDKLEAFRRWDLHLAWRPRVHEHVELALTFDLLNFMDRTYAEWGGRESFVPLGTTGTPGFFPSPERSYVGGVSVTVRR
jgi:iron complex outermembrane receptor protein